MTIELDAQPLLRSEITCPRCGHSAIEEMPTNACRIFYECVNCRVVLRPKAGDCCVFCSYGSVPCPPIQLDRQSAGDACCKAESSSAAC